MMRIHLKSERAHGGVMIFALEALSGRKHGPRTSPESVGGVLMKSLGKELRAEVAPAVTGDN
jgi:hypothetical protein